MKYVRADMVLPQKLLGQVREHCTGMIYVPSDGAFYRERNRQVMRLHGQGLPTAEIARRVFLGPRRVRQIIKSETDISKDTSRRKGAPTPQSGEGVASAMH